MSECDMHVQINVYLAKLLDRTAKMSVDQNDMLSLLLFFFCSEDSPSSDNDLVTYLYKKKQQ